MKFGSIEPFFSGNTANSVKNALESTPNTASPATSRSLRKKLKKAFVHAALVGSASYAMLAPLAAAASFFSIGSLLAQTATKTSAAGGSYNSQTLPLLSPAVNIDPRPSVGGGNIQLVDNSALLPQDGPEGTAADIASQPQSASISVYTVHQGDTLSSIAKMFGVSVNTIVWANNVRTIRDGDQLVILPITGVRYTAAKGDTLASIAKKYKADAGEIAQYNDLADDATLAVGQALIIPNGEVPPTAAQLAATARARSISAIASGKKTEPYLGGSGPNLAGFFSRPLQGGVMTQGLHGWNGVDFGAPTGSSVYAAAGGTVIVARSGGAWNGGYGNYVVVSHGNGTQSLYAHLSRVSVSVGASVSTGDLIGKVGSTGQSTGSHLHFEVRGAVNPFAH